MNWPDTKPEIEKPKTSLERRRLLMLRIEKQVKVLTDWELSTKALFISTYANSLPSTIEAARTLLWDCWQELQKKK